MKRRRVLPEPLAAAVKRADALLPAFALSRRLAGVQDAVEAMEQRYNALLSSRERAVRQLRAENGRLRQQLRELSVEKAILQDVTRRRLTRSLQQRQIIEYVTERYGLDARQAKRLLGHAGILPLKSYAKPGREWRLSLQDRAQLWVVQSYEQVNGAIQKKGWLVGRRLAYRVYIEEPRKQAHKQMRKAIAKQSGWFKRLRPKAVVPTPRRTRPA
jgi:putative transposase